MEERTSSEKFRKARQQRRHSRKITYSITGVPEMNEKSISAQYIELFISNGVDITIGKKIVFDNVTPAEINNYREHFTSLKQMYGDAAKYSENDSVLSITISVTDALQFERRYIYSE